MSERDQRIRQRAYEIWEEEGRLDGQHSEHWDRAAREIDAREGVGGGGPAQTGHSGPAATEGGLSTGLQPGGMSPGGGPAAGAGSIGTGGASSGGSASGSVKRSGV
jgi:Protein of unknown function (DUF2934)